jgi:hypothetical protein
MTGNLLSNHPGTIAIPNPASANVQGFNMNGYL